MVLAQQCGLLQGTNIYVDNLFTSADLHDHMGDKGTLGQKRTIGFLLPNKKQTNKGMKRGKVKAIYT
jgi:hypothetical protein